MFLTYVILALIVFTMVKRIVQAVKNKNHRDVWIALLLLPFCFFILVSVTFGGGALHDAANEYELYQEGHYYLVNHGRWTEVSHGTYIFVMISEIVGIVSFAVGFILGLLRFF